MNLKELKSMIAEEYNAYIAEQGVEAPADMPAIQVADTDVDATGGEDAEATLKDIYEMLKAYFGSPELSASHKVTIEALYCEINSRKKKRLDNRRIGNM